jgi:septum formation protein
MTRPVQPEPLILASVSPRRAELLHRAGYRFEIRHPSIAEPLPPRPTINPKAYAEALAYFKARSVVVGASPRLSSADVVVSTILSADTITVIDDAIIGKPKDRAHAREILTRLSGTTHRVITGVAVLDARGGRRLVQHDVTRVVFRCLTPEQIEAYLDSGEWQGKAGAYGIQDRADAFVERIEGSFSNVVGLPLERLGRAFEQWCGMTAVSGLEGGGAGTFRRPRVREESYRLSPDRPKSS